MPDPVAEPEKAPRCRDDRNPIGVCACDKRDEPSCCCVWFCAPCVFTNYEGCNLVAVLVWLFPFFFAPYVWCCWQPPIWGRHYNKERILIGQAHKTKFVAAGSAAAAGNACGAQAFPEWNDDVNSFRWSSLVNEQNSYIENCEDEEEFPLVLAQPGGNYIGGN